MKKILIILSILLLTGCGMQEKINMSINEDKSVDLVILKTASNKLIDAAINQKNNKNKEYTNEERWKYLEEQLKNSDNDNQKKFQIEKFEEGEYKGYRFIYKFNNIDDITDDNANFNIKNIIDITTSKIFKKENDIYISKITYSGIDPVKDMKYDMSFTITLPKTPISHNATTVSEDEKTLTWVTNTNKDGKIDFKFSFVEQKNNNKLYIGVGISLITIIIFIVIILKIRKKEQL